MPSAVSPGLPEFTTVNFGTPGSTSHRNRTYIADTSEISFGLLLEFLWTVRDRLYKVTLPDLQDFNCS